LTDDGCCPTDARFWKKEELIGAHCPNAARLLPRLSAESWVLVTKADI
jgi:hypothetical protein